LFNLLTDEQGPLSYLFEHVKIPQDLPDSYEEPYLRTADEIWGHRFGNEYFGTGDFGKYHRRLRRSMSFDPEKKDKRNEGFR